MTTSSVSFRITKHTEDLAQTIHALSQRLLQLEQRLTTLESHLTTAQEEAPSAEHLASLANVDQLLSDCRELLAESALPGQAALPDPLASAAPIHPSEATLSAVNSSLDGLDAAA